MEPIHASACGDWQAPASQTLEPSRRGASLGGNALYWKAGQVMGGNPIEEELVLIRHRAAFFYTLKEDVREPVFVVKYK